MESQVKHQTSPLPNKYSKITVAIGALKIVVTTSLTGTMMKTAAESLKVMALKT